MGRSLSLFIFIILPFMFFSCGKNNQSGQDSWQYPNPNTINPITNINSPYSFNNVSINQVLTENPCISSQNNVGAQRIPLQIPLTNFSSVIAPNDIFLGVTSYGDVAVLVGQATNTPPLFVAYLCPRSFSPTGQGQLLGVKIGSYSQCLFKPITAASVVFPGGSSAEFRWADGGSSARQKFSFCR